MIKVLIVDDEPMLRMALKTIINWESLGYQIVGEAPNGKVAQGLIHELSPQVVITDIKMPELDGIGLIRYIGINNLPIKVIVLSGFDDFEYVREALLLGAIDYILKPSISEKMLISLMLKIKNEISDYKDNQSEYSNDPEDLQEKLEKIICLNSTDDSLQNKKELSFLNKPYIVCILKLCYNTLLKRYEKQKNYILRNVISDMILRFLGKDVVSFFIGIDKCVLIIPAEEKIYFDNIEKLANSIELYTGIHAVAGISQNGQGIKDLHKCYQQGLEAVKYYFYKNQLLFHYGSLKFSIIPQQFWDQKQIQYLLDLINQNSWNELIGYQPKCFELDNIYYQPDQIKDFVKEYIIFLQINLIGKINSNETWISQQQLEEHIARIEKIEELKEFVKQIVTNFCNHVDAEMQKLHSGVIREVLKIINKRYNEDINLMTVAQCVNMNATYLGRLFVKEMGVKFTNYLTQVRIEKAKSLLKNSLYGVEEIAQMVGYENTKYFFKIFKKQTGISPRKFRQNKS